MPPLDSRSRDDPSIVGDDVLERPAYAFQANFLQACIVSVNFVASLLQIAGDRLGPGRPGLGRAPGQRVMGLRRVVQPGAELFHAHRGRGQGFELRQPLQLSHGAGLIGVVRAATGLDQQACQARGDVIDRSGVEAHSIEQRAAAGGQAVVESGCAERLLRYLIRPAGVREQPEPDQLRAQLRGRLSQRRVERLAVPADGRAPVDLLGTVAQGTESRLAFDWVAQLQRLVAGCMGDPLPHLHDAGVERGECAAGPGVEQIVPHGVERPGIRSRSLHVACQARCRTVDRLAQQRGRWTVAREHGRGCRERGIALSDGRGGLEQQGEVALLVRCDRLGEDHLQNLHAARRGAQFHGNAPCVDLVRAVRGLQFVLLPRGSDVAHQRQRLREQHGRRRATPPVRCWP